MATTTSSTNDTTGISDSSTTSTTSTTTTDGTTTDTTVTTPVPDYKPVKRVIGWVGEGDNQITIYEYTDGTITQI